jgi:hypothetical protein
VIRNGRDWAATEPRYNLPVRFRNSVPAIEEALAAVQQAYRQLNPGL